MLIKLQMLKTYLEENPGVTETQWSEFAELTRKETNRLLRWGIIKNKGSKRNPRWTWVGSEPNTRMANKLSAKSVYRKRRSQSSSVIDSVIRHSNVKITVNNDIKVEVMSKNDIVISRKDTRFRVNDADTLINILSLLS
jgi:hypothetical protein